MVLLRAWIAMCVLVTSAAVVARVPLDGFISFDDAYRCVASKDLRALLEGVIRWREVGETYKGRLASPPIPAGFRKQVGKPSLAIDGNEYRATVPLRGTWRGLTLHSLVVVQWVESEAGFYLVFEETREQVRDAANKAGFGIPASGSEYRDEDVMGVNVGIDTHDGKASLYCIVG